MQKGRRIRGEKKGQFYPLNREATSLRAWQDKVAGAMNSGKATELICTKTVSRGMLRPLDRRAFNASSPHPTSSSDEPRTLISAS